MPGQGRSTAVLGQVQIDPGRLQTAKSRYGCSLFSRQLKYNYKMHRMAIPKMIKPINLLIVLIQELFFQ